MMEMMIFSGGSHPQLASQVANQLGLALGSAAIERYSDGELNIRVNDNVRGRDCFIVQPTCAPTNDNIMSLLLLSDAMHRASAGRITAVIPYFGYARQDRRQRSARVPISAKVVADMMSAAGIHRVLTVDLHSEQIQGFFDIPVDNAYCTALMMADIQNTHPSSSLCVVSPDVGGVVRARAFAKGLGTDLAIIDKRRPKANEAEAIHVMGDVKGKTCLIVDDLIDTGGTLCAAASALKSAGAAKISAYCTHPVLSGDANARISESLLDELVVTDTIPLSAASNTSAKIRSLSVAPMLSEAIRRVSTEASLSELFAL